MVESIVLERSLKPIKECKKRKNYFRGQWCIDFLGAWNIEGHGQAH